MADALIKNIEECPYRLCREAGECRGITFGGCRDRDAIEAFLGERQMLTQTQIAENGMSDLFRVCVFVPVASEGDASAGIQAAIQIALELGFGVDVHPMSLCPNANNSAPASGVRLSEGSFRMTGG